MSQIKGRSYAKMKEKSDSFKAFTLLELLIVIGILAILSTIVIVVINPANLLAKARDSGRISDLSTINEAINILMAFNSNVSLGSINMLYVSLPSNESNCSDLDLLSLPSGWSYHCVAEDNLRKVDGNGWIPVNFTQMDTGSPISHLPVDPINTASSLQYYTYAVGHSWELTAQLESTKFASRQATDGGPDPTRYELGSDIKITPFVNGLVGYWDFNEDSGITAEDSSGYGNNGTLTNGPTWEAASDCVSGSCLSFDGGDDYVDCGEGNNAFESSSFTWEAWYKPIVHTNWGSLIIKSVSAEGTRHHIHLYNNYRFHYGLGNSHWSANNAVFTIGTWTHLVWTYDGSNNRVYQNGSLLQTTSYTGGVPSSDTNLRIGGGSVDPKINGLIDEVRIYNRALSPAEIQAIYNATK